MKKNKNITLLLTFDYELFLGARSGTVKKCLIEPTNAILEVLTKHNQIGVFFIDTTYLYRLNELKEYNNNAKEDYEIILMQLQDLAKRGHFLFHHLHPHWLDATYLTEYNEWDLSNHSRFTFSTISPAERDLIFSFSNELLTSIYMSVNSKQLPNGFRAGGLFIEPFQDFIPYFRQHNIKNEFSVVPGAFRDNANFSYNFTSAPMNRAYKISDNLSKENEFGEIMEYPISVLELSGFNKIMNSLYYRLNKTNEKYHPFGDGVSVSNLVNQENSNKSLKSYFNMKIPASIEIMNPGNRRAFSKMLQNTDYIHLLSHPKLLTAISLIELDHFLKNIKKQYEVISLKFDSE